MKIINALLPFCIIKREALLKLKADMLKTETHSFKPAISLITDDELAKMYSTLSTRQIAKILGVSKSVVYEHLTKRGISRRERIEAMKMGRWPGIYKPRVPA